MFDKVSNKIEFEVSTEERARQIYEAICEDNEFSFQSFGFPSDFDAYCDVLGREEDRNDFWERVLFDWNSFFWFIEYRSCEIGDLEWLGGKASFAFQTLWRVPYPVIVAFATKFKVPFTLKYIKNNGIYWGIEVFELDENGQVKKTSERLCLKEDLVDLQIELIGGDPEQKDEERINQVGDREEVQSA